jgi:hypothetical protein
VRKDRRNLCSAAVDITVDATGNLTISHILAPTSIQTYVPTSLQTVAAKPVAAAKPPAKPAAKLAAKHGMGTDMCGALGVRGPCQRHVSEVPCPYHGIRNSSEDEQGEEDHDLDEDPVTCTAYHGHRRMCKPHVPAFAPSQHNKENYYNQYCYSEEDDDDDDDEDDDDDDDDDEDEDEDEDDQAIYIEYKW